MKVTLISYTPDAMDVLLFTKNTRLQMSPGLFDEIKSWPHEKKLQELEYMRNTIQSSWEFVDYIFLIEGVSRAFTHQLVRHRHNSYAQQAQRAVDMTGFEYITGPSIGNNPAAATRYDLTMEAISSDYRYLIDTGVAPQDARGILPTNIATNIVVKANLRSLHDMSLKRLCVKAQGEAQDVFRAMVEAVKEVHPWTDKWLRVWCATYGTCCFPTYPVEQCPAKAMVYDPVTRRPYGGGPEAHTGTLEDIYNTWLNNRAEAQPGVVRADEN